MSVSLTVKDAAAALDFYVAAFGAVELFRLPDPDGSIAHAEFMIGNSKVYISGESPEWNAMAMADGAMASCLFALDVESCDEAHQRAVNAGAKSLSEPTDQFWGTRSSMVLDDYGYRWNFNQFIEDVSPEEMAKRAKAIFG